MARLTHKVHAEVTVPSSIVQRYGAEMIHEYLLALIVAEPYDESPLTASWAARFPNLQDDGAHCLQVAAFEGNIISDAKRIQIRLSLQDNMLLDAIEGLDRLSDEELRLVAASAKIRKSAVRRI